MIEKIDLSSFNDGMKLLDATINNVYSLAQKLNEVIDKLNWQEDPALVQRVMGEQLQKDINQSIIWNRF